MQTKSGNRRLRWFSAVIFGLALYAVITPVWAAGYAYVNAAVYLRAGPRIGFPILTTVYPGSGVYVHGCLSDYVWCDVSFSGERGWMDAAYLDYPYNNEFVPIINYGPYLGIAVFSFNIGGYWRQHYFHRRWYRDRDHFRARFGPNGRHGVQMRHRQFQQPWNWRQRQRHQNFRGRSGSGHPLRIPDRRNRSVAPHPRAQRHLRRKDQRKERVLEKTRSMQPRR